MARSTGQARRKPFFDELTGSLVLIVRVFVLAIVLAEHGSTLLSAALLLLRWAALIVVAAVLAAALGGVVIVAAMVNQGVVLPRVRVVRCPDCKLGAMERIPAIPSGYQYYSCSRCGARWKRLSPEDVWVAAKSPDGDEAVHPVHRHGHPPHGLGPIVIAEGGREGDAPFVRGGPVGVWDRWLDG
jgi:hypothetical protein